MKSLIKEAEHDIESACTIPDMELIKGKYLGRNGKVRFKLKEISNFSLIEKKNIGKELNIIKNRIEILINNKLNLLLNNKINSQIYNEKLDVSLPGIQHFIGTNHPITKTVEYIKSFFSILGFIIADGPDIENSYYNFSALNIHEHHPSRDSHDTFYIDNINDNNLLRTHTSCVQARFMENNKPPFRLISPGKVYRCDNDISHSPMFHQIEGLLIEEKVSLAHLKGLMEYFLLDFFGNNITIRFRPSYFPFTEPSIEIDILFQNQWLEVLGCGLVHNNILNNFSIDYDKYIGLAFGLGVERLLMIYYNINDIRLLYQNDLRFIKQF
jgi:phenylalanyl-tRNA synthetase alpha chain